MGPIDDTLGMDVIIKTLISGELCYNVLRYVIIADAPEENSPEEFSVDWTGACQDALTACMSDAAQVLTIEFNPTIPSGEGYTFYPPYIYPAGLTGDVASQCLPPFVSYRIYKIPNPASQSPSTPELIWRNGMVRLPGVPESFQESGVLTGPALTALQALADELGTVTIGTNTWELYQKRVIAGDRFYVISPVCVAGSLLGTQNSRKP